MRPAATRRGWAWLALILMVMAGSTLPLLTFTASLPPSIKTWAAAFSRTARPWRAWAPTRFLLGFGLTVVDANNDGFPDLAQANGHVADFRPMTPYAMPAQLFLGYENGRFVDVSEQAGPPWKSPRLGRGLASGDFDNDGRVDLLLVADNTPLTLLHNQSANQNHFLVIALEGTSSNRDGVGRKWPSRPPARPGSLHDSAEEAIFPRATIGFSSGWEPRVADHVEVTWPSGRRDTYQNLAADAGYRLREHDSEPRPIAGFTPGRSRP